MQDKQYLLIPGPTPVPPTVVAAMSKPIIGHRERSLPSCTSALWKKLQKVFQTKNDIFVVTHSGTGALETAIANTVSPGDKVLSLITGNFGKRLPISPGLTARN